MGDNRDIKLKLCDLVDQLRDISYKIVDKRLYDLVAEMDETISDIDTDIYNHVRNSLDDRYTEKHEKVIFLDIDGVLNGEDFRDGPYLDENMVQQLKRIVDETGAEIILTSSWRGAFYYYFEQLAKYKIEKTAIGPDEKRALRATVTDRRALEILDTLEKYGMSFAGETHQVTTGHTARPVEIREWLLDKPYLKSFVILDDDGFWSWNWLRQFLVLTTRKDTESENTKIPKYIDGLDEKFANQAIRILNEYTATRQIDEDHLKWDVNAARKWDPNISDEEIAKSKADSYEVDVQFLRKKIAEISESTN